MICYTRCVIFDTHIKACAMYVCFVIRDVIRDGTFTTYQIS